MISTLCENNDRTDRQNFSSKVSDARNCLIHFWATWNGVGVQQKKVIEELEAEFPSVEFYSMEVDPKENHAICLDHDVGGPPTIATYSDGIRKHTHIGLLQTNQIREILTSVK